MAKLTTSKNPLTEDYNTLLTEWKQYNTLNPDKPLDFNSFHMIKAASPNFSIGSNTNTINNDLVSGLNTTLPKADTQANNTVAGGNAVTGTGSVTTTTPDISSIVADIYSKDKEAIEANKKFLIGSAIGKSILNVSNLANAFAKRPQFIGAAAIPNVEYPDVTGSMTADMNRSLGTYRSGISRYSAEKGLSPDVRIGAEGEALSKELEQRAKISALQNENQIAQTTANAQINEANIKNQYESKIADQERMDAINKGRSLLYQQGLTNIGKIGTELGTGLIEQRNRMLDTEALNKYITLYQDAVATGKYKGGFYDYMKQNFGIDFNKTENITTNIPLTTTQIGETGTK